MLKLGAVAALAALSSAVYAVSSQTYSWTNVVTGGGGGFVPNIVFNPTEKGLAYARTDIGGVYRLNSDDSWTPLVDFADNARWNYWGSDALATDPVDTDRVYVATGMYTNSYDPNDGQILISQDKGSTWTPSVLPFKVGGNMPGRGMGERLAVDPNDNAILYFGARSGHGLWKSTNYGVTWANVTSFTSTGNYMPDPTDTTGYNDDLIGIAWVTFDSTSGSSGTATPRIFVGVASMGIDNVFVSENAGSTWTAIAGQNHTYIPHKGTLSPKEGLLYISYSNGAGPYDGTDGYVKHYNISSGVWTDITPAGEYFGFGGLAIDAQKPGTVMVAALNSWWPDGQIYRSNNSGATWSALWDWGDYPTIYKNYKYSDSNAPWLGPDETITTLGTLQIGWMMEGLSIDPFDSNHWLYGTGATILGGHDLLTWDTTNNVTLESLAVGIEEMSVQDLISPPTGPTLLSAVGDDGGFAHTSLTTAPLTEFVNPEWATCSGLDYAGLAPTNIVRVGTGDSTPGEVAISTDSGATWNQDYGAPDNVTGGKVAFSASGDTVLWSSASNGVLVSQYTDAFVAVSSLPSGAAIASDKLNNSIFYGASGSKFYLSQDGGKTFTSTGTVGSSTAPVKVVVNTKVTGDVWVSSDAGLFHTTNSGTTFTAAAGLGATWGFALGAPATSTAYPSIFVASTIGGTVGYFRSDDEGATWVQINDATHGFGSAAANAIAADVRTYGRVFIGTNGRGIFYGDISGSVSSSSIASTASTAKSTTTTSSTKTTSTISSTTTVKSTTTTSTTTTSTSTTSSSTSGSVGAYGQCGGTGWTGGTACVSGYACTYSNPYYSQCIPS